MADSLEGNLVEAEDALLPYRLRERFLTTPEVALFRALREMVGDRYVIFAKVALNDVFSIIRPNENVHYFNRLFRKHVDFLLCEPRSLKPQIGVELVRPLPAGGARLGDQFMEDLFLTAGLALVQVPADNQYDIGALVALFQSSLSKAKQTGRKVAALEGDSVPMCPVCGKMMVLRTYRSGAAAGKLYYGCIDNPTCPGNVPLK
jgi:predicted RNA-binding Zn-ribbon protein involved in translation (DUF1610 family)